MALISNGSMVLLKYKLNNVRGADNRPANGAQRTEYFLYTTIYCGCQYQKNLNIVFTESVAQNVIRIISVLNAYYGNNAYCVRIK